jgi:hypothetical protein
MNLLISECVTYRTLFFFTSDKISGGSGVTGLDTSPLLENDETGTRWGIR